MAPIAAASDGLQSLAAALPCEGGWMLATLRAMLIDLDGVIYQDEQLVPGAPSAVAWIRAQAILHVFVTNTTSRARRALVDKLTRFGIPVNDAEIVTPTVIAPEWLRREACEPAALFVPAATQPDFVGVNTLAEDAETGAGSVVLGDLGPAWTFAALNRAFRLLMENPGAQLIALGTSRYWRASDGLRLDVGPFVAALEHATSRSALVLGKPSRQFFEIALMVLGCSAAETVMVGDDIAADVEGAQRAGMRGVLVRTGKFRETDLRGHIRADGVLNSIADLPSWWREHRSGWQNTEPNA
jgi:HAD superfamily hydrolase (TIGR01458 family)